jgi:hypothetical protein
MLAAPALREKLGGTLSEAISHPAPDRLSIRDYANPDFPGLAFEFCFPSSGVPGIKVEAGRRPACPGAALSRSVCHAMEAILSVTGHVLPGK